jgi:hypothetical protein
MTEAEEMDTRRTQIASICLLQERVLFGKNIPPPINALLQAAAGSTDNFAQAEKLLLQAKQQAPEQLPVYTALYKLYFYNGYTDKAEDMVFQSLHKAAKQGGFHYDWRQVQAQADWTEPDSVGRAYLYSLKALAFIRLRQHDYNGAQAVLDSLRRLDPDDVVGANVTRDLAASLAEEQA